MTIATQSLDDNNLGVPMRVCAAQPTTILITSVTHAGNTMHAEAGTEKSTFVPTAGIRAG